MKSWKIFWVVHWLRWSFNDVSCDTQFDSHELRTISRKLQPRFNFHVKKIDWTKLAKISWKKTRKASPSKAFENFTVESFWKLLFYRQVYNHDEINEQPRVLINLRIASWNQQRQPEIRRSLWECTKHMVREDQLEINLKNDIYPLIKCFKGIKINSPIYGAKNDPKWAAVELIPKTEFRTSVGNISAVCKVKMA